MTILLFVFAEVTPKTFAVKQTDQVALRLAPLILALFSASLATLFMLAHSAYQAILAEGESQVMQAANEGAHSVNPKALKRSVGIRIALPFEQDVNPFVGQAYEHRTFFSRLHHFMIMSDAFVVVPGGIGTLLELSLAWQLLQVSKLYNTPLILVGKMWAELVDWGRRSMLHKDNELANEIDFEIPHCVNTMDECIAVIRENRAAWLAAQKLK